MVRTDVGTVFAFKLTRAVTLDDILNVYLAVIDRPPSDPNSGTDWLGLPAPAFFDMQGNAVRPGPAHALSDFAAGFVSTLYAFDSKDALLGEGQFLSGEWIVRDFSGGGGNAGRLFVNKDIFIAARVDEPLIGDLGMVISIAPPADSVSTYFNARTGRKSRLWLPWTYDSTSPIAEVGNRVNGTTTRSLLSVPRAVPSSSINFVLYNDPESPPANPALSFNWKAPAQVQFLYELFSAAPGAAGWDIPGYTPAVTDPNNIGGGNQYYIDHDADENIPPSLPSGIPTPRVPLYGIRLADPSDPLSLDLWSFELADILRQRGGVTILNNVINSLAREKTHIEVYLPSAGSLTVAVLTLDGNIVKYLKRGREEKGLHYYSWDGTNNNGTPVARGMYFVRVVGPEINEVRKVMVVKE